MSLLLFFHSYCLCGCLDIYVDLRKFIYLHTKIFFSCLRRSSRSHRNRKPLHCIDIISIFTPPQSKPPPALLHAPLISSVNVAVCVEVSGLTYSRCFKAPLASSWVELLSGGKTQGESYTSCPLSFFRELTGESSAVRGR